MKYIQIIHTSESADSNENKTSSYMSLYPTTAHNAVCFLGTSGLNDCRNWNEILADAIGEPDANVVWYVSGIRQGSLCFLLDRMTVIESPSQLIEIILAARAPKVAQGGL
jgi:hypothetical protein